MSICRALLRSHGVSPIDPGVSIPTPGRRFTVCEGVGPVFDRLIGEANVTRRRLLTAVPGVAGAALLAGAAAASEPQPRATTAPRLRKPHPVERTAVVTR